MDSTKNPTTIRAYTPEDRAVLLELLRSNIPVYFDPSEMSDFLRYLDKEIESYFVVERQGEVIASGGVNFFPEEKIARLSWDLVHPDYQGMGVGKKLAKHRLEHIASKGIFDTVVVRTTQWVFPFYEKLGFETQSITKDYWAKGYDMYYMTRPVHQTSEKGKEKVS